jgi:uncharacterized protein
MSDEPKNQIKQLSKLQRRVVGVLMEKAFTTPEQYPLTLKSTVTGCNQKSNRDPVGNYSEGQVQDALDQMRDSLLVAEVFTDGGRAPRYRHYLRHKFDFTEAQFAIIAELLLRGRQQPGELRTRASRMVRIDSQEQLRQELTSLQEKGYLQSNGPLDRRGVEVDHTFYLPKEGMAIGNAPTISNPETHTDNKPSAPANAVAATSAASVSPVSESVIEELRTTIQEQASVIQGLESLLSELDERLQKLERDLGV